MSKQLCPESHREVSSSYRAKLARTCPLVNPALLAQTNYKHTKGGKQPPETALNEHTIDQFLNKPISTWTCGLLLKTYAVQLSGKPCVLLSCCPVRVSKQASSAASLASWLNSPGTGQRRGAPKINNKRKSKLFTIVQIEAIFRTVISISIRKPPCWTEPRC